MDLLLLVPLVTHFILTIVVADEECGHPLTTAVKNHLVKDDPFQYYGGVLTDVWVQKKYLENIQCSYSKYFTMPDGTVQEEAFMYNKAGNKNKLGVEVIQKTDSNGVLTLWGLNDDSEKYIGKTYVFHADQNALGFYSCQPGGEMWNMGIQVRTREGLESAIPTPVSTSLEQAKATMDQILKETEHQEKIEMAQYDLGKICFES